MADHIRIYHREYASPANPNNHGRFPLPASLWDSMKIEQREYESCGIDQSLIPPPFDFIQYGTPFSTIVPPVTPSGGKRARAFTNTMTDAPARKQPRHT